MSTSAPPITSTFYIAGPVINDPNVLKQQMIDYLTSFMPIGWRLEDGDLIDLILTAVAIVASQQADVANAMLANAFRYFGLLVGCPPIDPTPATAIATFTVQDDSGYTISSPAVVGLTDPTGTLQGFDTTANLLIPAGSTTGTAVVVAETAGVVANGLSGTAQVVQAEPFVTGATLALSSGGVDAELDAVYLDRLAETLTLLSPRPLLAPDFAVLARSIAGVYRATAVDLLKPGPPYDTSAEATGVEKSVTVAVTDINGLSVGSTIRGQVTAFLESLRDQNFEVWTVDAHYTEIDVTATVGAWPGWDTSDVHTRVVAALQSGPLSPAVAQTDPNGNAARWATDPILRLAELHNAVMNVQGVRWVDPLTFGIHGGSLAATDVTLGSGSAIPALPTAGTLTITVNATT